MPLRHSTVPNLDLSASTLHANPKISSPLSPGPPSSDIPSPLTPRSPKSFSISPSTQGPTIRPVTQDRNNRSASAIFPISPSTAEDPDTPSVTAIPECPPPPKESTLRHTRDVSRSFFGNRKAPKSSHQTQGSDGSDNSGQKPRSRGSSRDRRTQLTSKHYGSTPDLLSSIKQAEEQATGKSVFMIFRLILTNRRVQRKIRPERTRSSRPSRRGASTRTRFCRRRPSLVLRTFSRVPVRFGWMKLP